MRFTPTVACLGMLLCSSSPVMGQTGDGYIGIYRDSLGTQACASVPAYTSATLYVIAKTSGQSAGGITGAEFRIEVASPSGWYILYNAPSTANVVSGNAIDTNPDPNEGGGVNLAFQSCQVPNAGGQIKLGTVSVFNASGSTTKLLVKRHSHPTNVGFACALFVKCNNPNFTKVCMTPAPPDSCTLGGQKATVATVDDPTIFTASLNESGGESAELPSSPEREVLVLFGPGIVQLPPGQNYATLASTTINSAAIAAVLETYSIEGIAKAFPHFNLADTVAVARTGETVRLQDLSEIYRLQMQEGGNPTLLSADLAALTDEVGYAEPNGGATLLECVNDPLFPNQWSLENEGGSSCTVGADIDFCGAYTFTPGSASTKIAIIDDGVHIGHPDFSGRVSGDPDRATIHGTYVAGIAAASANNGIGVAGVDGNAQIISKDIFRQPATHPKTAAGVRDAANLGAVILNNSWHLGGPDSQGKGIYSSTVRGAFRDVYVRNCIATAAMGNNYGSFVFYPAGFGQGIIAVGATDCNDAHHPGSTMGKHIDVAAPGVGFWTTTLPPGYYADVPFGTSYATPLASGLAGLLLAAKPYLYNDDIEQLIRLSADDVNQSSFAGWDSLLGTGRINADKALKRLQLPYRLHHGTATGGEVEAISDPFFEWFLVPPKPHGAGYHLVDRYEVQRDVTFPVSFMTTPNVWGRGVATIGYDSDPTWCMGWCDVVPGTITSSGCRLRTFVYRVWNGTEILGWWPTYPDSVQFAYTALGTLAPTDFRDEPSATVPVSLSSASPLRRGTTIALTIPQPGQVRVEVFDVAGRRVGILQDGELSRGQHELKWDGLSNTGKSLASGLYFARVTTQSGVVTRKLVVVE